MMHKSSVLLLSMALDFGGAETHVVSLAKALAKEGLRVNVVSNGGPLVRELEAAGIGHFPVALHARNPRAILSAVGTVRHLVEQEQVELMHAHARIPAWVAEKVSRQSGVPLITTYHGLYDDHWLLRLFTTAGERTIAVSDDVRDHLAKKLGIPREQIRVIHNGIDTEQFRTLPYDGRQQVTYISRLAGERGGVALALLGACALLKEDFPDLTVTIVGAGDRLQEVQESCQQLNTTRGEAFCRALGARGDIPTLLGEAGVVVGVGRVALEAMAAGRPVVIAGEYGLYGLLDEATLPIARERNYSGRGAAQATTPETLAEALRLVLSNAEQAQAAARLAQTTVENHYSVAEKAREVLAVYREILPELGIRGEAK